MSTERPRARYYVLAGLAVLVGGLLVLQLANLRGCTTAARARRDGGTPGMAAAGHGRGTGPLFSSPDRLLESLRLEGVVVDQQGARVPGASVLLNGPVRRETTADEKGEFVVADLNPNSYDVEAWAGDATGGPIRVHLSRDTRPVTIRIFAAGRLEVTIVTPEDKPIADAEVALRVGGNQRNLAFLRAGKTGADGKLLIRGVSPSGYFIVVWAKGFQPRVEPLDAPAGLRWEYRMVLQPGVSVSGRVVDEHGAPVAGAHVNFTEPLRSLPLVQPRVWPFTPTTDRNGAFTIPAIGPGDHQLTARHDEFEMGASDIFKVGTTPLSGLLIKMGRGAAIQGTVTIGGRPAPFAAVRASTGHGGPVRTLYVETTCDASGRFKLGGLPRGPITVLAVHDGVTSEQVPVDLSGSDKTDLVLALTLDGAVSGRVLASNRQPIAAAVVVCITLAREVVGLRPVTVETTDADGVFSCRGLPAGEVQVNATRPGSNNNVHAGLRGADARARVGDQGIEIIIPEDGVLSGRVTLGTGGPAKEFQLSLVKGLRPHVIRSEDGRFSLDGLGAKDYKMTVQAAGHKTKLLPVSVREGQTTDVGEIALEAGEDPPPEPKIPRVQRGQSLSDVMAAATQAATKQTERELRLKFPPFQPPPDPPPK